MKRKRGLLLVLGMLLSARLLMGQGLDDFSALKEKYPNADAAGLKVSKKLYLDLVDGKPEITYTQYEEMIYLGNKPTGYSKRSFSSSSLMELLDIKASVLTPEDNRYKEKKIQEFKEASMADGHVFYDGGKELSFYLSGLERGSKSVIQAVYKINDPHMIPSLSINPYIPVENCEWEISFPHEFDLDFKTFNLDTTGMKYTETRKGKRTIRRYYFPKSPYIDYQDDAPATRYFSPELHVRMNSYMDKGNQVPVLRNVADLYEWYRGFVSRSREDFGQLKALADSIAGNVVTDREKAEKIYQWVQRNISYIAFEEGYNGYIPQKASEVCMKRFGDCKGMANLLHSLMRSQGLKAHITWVGTRSLPYRYEEVASPAVDDHMIVYFEDNGKGYFLDPTHSNLPFELPSPFIQGKEAMVSLNDERYEIKSIPITPAEKNSAFDSCTVELSGSSITGQGVAYLAGYRRMSLVDDLNFKDYKKLKEYMLEELQKGSNKFQLDTVWVENLQQPGLPLKVHYKFHVPDQVISNGNELYVNLNLNRSVIPARIDTSRKVPVEFRFAMLDNSVVTLAVPKGYEVTSCPADFALDHETLAMNNTYVQRPDKVTRSFTLTEKQLLLEPLQFAKRNEAIRQINGQFGKQIILRKK